MWDQKKLKQKISKLNKNQRDTLLSVIVSVFVTFLAIFIFNFSIWEYTWGLLMVFLVVHTTLSAFIVIESLFYAGAQISLALFIADMFCKVPNRTEDANHAFILLGIFTILFILFKLLERLIHNLKKIYTDYFSEDRKSQPNFYKFNILVFSTTLFAISYAAYQIFETIVVNICRM